MKAKFIKAVDNGDLVSVRLFLANELMLDPRGATFAEMKAYAESRFTNLYDIQIEAIQPKPEAEWNEEYLYELKNDLDSRFTCDMLSLYERVAKTVLREKADGLNREKTKSEACSYEQPRRTAGGHSDDSQKKRLYAGVTIGGAVVTVAGFCVSRLALASLGLAGVVIGGVLLYNESKK